MTRKDFLRGVGAAGAGGLVVGGVAGYFGGRASESTTTTQATASTSKEPLVIGSGVPVTGVYAGDGQQMLRGQQLAVAEINAAGGVLGQPLKLAILDTKAQEPDVMKSVLQKFVSQNVAAIFVPFTTYTWGSGQNCAQNSQTVIGSGSRGQVRPVWAMLHYHYNRRVSLDDKYISQLAFSVAPEGGGGDYGSTSGGYDQLGFGTLMYAK